MRLSFILDKIYRLVAWLSAPAWGRKLVAFGIRLMMSTSLEQKIAETETLLAFYHPRPAYRFHVLLVPKKPFASLLDLTDEQAIFLVDVLESVKKIVGQYQLEGYGYRLVCNGGAYQDFPYLHFHLISDLSGESDLRS